MDPRNYNEFDGIAMDFNSQKLMGVRGNKYYSLIGKPRLEYTRERDNKGPKILHTSFSPNSDNWFNTNHQLLAYDHLIAVDTNTNQVAGSKVSITAAYHVIPETQQQGLAQCKAAVIALIECWNVTDKPENLGWYHVLQAISEYPEQFAGKVGLIVDSDLGNHQSFNSREIPIFADFYLPENVTILYASDKGGAEHLSTMVIKYCHNLASDLYKGQNLLLNTEGLYDESDRYFSHIRQWDTENMDLRPFCTRK